MPLILAIGGNVGWELLQQDRAPGHLRLMALSFVNKNLCRSFELTGRGFIGWPSRYTETFWVLLLQYEHPHCSFSGCTTLQSLSLLRSFFLLAHSRAWAAQSAPHSVMEQLASTLETLNGKLLARFLCLWAAEMSTSLMFHRRMTTGDNFGSLCFRSGTNQSANAPCRLFLSLQS